MDFIKYAKAYYNLFMICLDVFFFGNCMPKAGNFSFKCVKKDRRRRGVCASHSHTYYDIKGYNWENIQLKAFIPLIYVCKWQETLLVSKRSDFYLLSMHPQAFKVDKSIR